MTDIASLVMKVDATSVKDADKALGGLEKQAHKTEQSAAAMSSTFSAFKGVIAGIGFIGAAREAVAMTDSYTKLTAQLKLATSSQEEMAVAMSDVTRISKTTQSDISAVTALYSRLSHALKETGASQKQIADISETVALGLKVGGASAQEAASAMLQLSQAFGSGVLRGEEFNAVSESAPNLLRALAASMGVTYGELRKLAADGQITSDVLRKAFSDPALLNSLREQGKEVQTISGAFQTLKDAAMQLTGTMNSVSGSSSMSAKALGAFADSIQRLANRVNTLREIANQAWIAIRGGETGKQVSEGKIRGMGDTGAAAKPDADTKFVTKRFAELNEQLAKGDISMAKYRDGIKKMYAELNSEDDKRTKRVADLTDAQRDLQQSALEAQRVIFATDPIAAASAEWEKLVALEEKGLLTDKQIADFYVQTYGKEDVAAAEKSAKAMADANEKEAKRAQQAWENFTSNVQRNLGDVLYNGLTGGFKNIGDAFKQMLLRMSADAAAAQITQAMFGSEKGGGALGQLGGMIGNFFAPSFAGGGFTGGGVRSGGVDGMGGFPAILHPNETVVDHSKGQAAAPSVTVVQNISIDSRTDANVIMGLMSRAKDMAKSEIMNELQRGGGFAMAVGRA